MKRFITAVAVVLGFLSSMASAEIKCNDTLNGLGEKKAKKVTLVCPAKCKSGNVWGSDVYTTDSAICVAAVHAGAIDKKKGGPVTITTSKGQSSYSGSSRNGVTTSSWGSFDRSFKFVK